MILYNILNIVDDICIRHESITVKKLTTGATLANRTLVVNCTFVKFNLIEFNEILVKFDCNLIELHKI